MVRFLFSLLFFTVALADLASQQKHHISTILNIKYPKELRVPAEKSEEGLEHTDALFGLPFLHNRSISASVFYMTPNFAIGKSEINGCDGYETMLSENELRVHSSFYLVDRGGCSFIDKASLAQSVGAEGIIIPNDECLKSDIEFFENHGLDEDEIHSLCCKSDFMSQENCVTKKNEAFEYLPFMVTSSKGQALSINIPAMLVTFRESLQLKICLCESQKSISSTSFCSKRSGGFKKLANELSSNCGDIKKTGMIAEMKLDTPHPDGKVKFQLWMKPDKQPALVHSLKWFAESIKDKSEFEPNYIVHQIVQCNIPSEDSSGEGVCDKFCKTLDNDKRLCYLPENDNLNLYGVDFLDEIVRQVCIFRIDSKKWWEYQDAYRRENCATQHTSETFYKCSMGIIDDMFASKSKIVDCIDEKTSEILASLDSYQTEMGIFTTSVVVNSRIMHFSMTADEVGKRVCDGYASHTLPHVCSCIRRATNEREFSLCSECTSKKDCSKVINSEQVIRDDDTSKASNRSLLMVLLFLSALIAAAFVYTRHTKRQMRAEMTSLMQEYMPLEEQGSHFERMMGGSTFGKPSNREDANLI